MPGGAALLGELLAGGDRLDKQDAFQQGRLRSLQGDKVLEEAALAQSKARTAQAMEAAAKYTREHPQDWMNPDGLMMQNAIEAGYGNDFQSFNGGRKTAQEMALRGGIADLSTSPEQRVRNQQALGQQPHSDFQSVGGHIVDMTAPPTAGLSQYDATPDIAQFAFREGLTPEQQASWDTYQASQNAAKHPNANHINAGNGLVYGADGKPIIDPTRLADDKAHIAGGVRAAIKDADYQAHLAKTFEGAKAMNAEMQLKYKTATDTASRLISDPTLWAGVGSMSMLANAPGTPAARIKSELDSLMAQTLDLALQQARALSQTGASGYGSLTQQEGENLKKVYANIGTIQDPASYREALGRYIKRLEASGVILEDKFASEYRDFLGRQSAPTLAPHGTAPNTAGWQRREDLDNPGTFYLVNPADTNQYVPVSR